MIWLVLVFEIIVIGVLVAAFLIDDEEEQC